MSLELRVNIVCVLLILQSVVNGVTVFFMDGVLDILGITSFGYRLWMTISLILVGVILPIIATIKLRQRHVIGVTLATIFSVILILNFTITMVFGAIQLLLLRGVKKVFLEGSVSE